MSVRGTSPNIPVRNLAETLAFYKDTLGFRQVIDNPDYRYALVQRDAALIALFETDNEDLLALTGTQFQAQIWVENVDAMWEELKDGLEALPEGRMRGPFDQAYGTRELHVKCPDGFLMLFTQDDSLEDEGDE